MTHTPTARTADAGLRRAAATGYGARWFRTPRWGAAPQRRVNGA